MAEILPSAFNPCDYKEVKASEDAFDLMILLPAVQSATEAKHTLAALTATANIG